MIIALGQIDIVCEDKKKNMERMEKVKILESDVILFLKMSLTGFSMSVEKVASDNILKWAKYISKGYDIFLG